MIENYNQQILETVYWALGIVFLISISLIGYSWFLNFKTYEKDKNIMKNEIIQLLNTEIDKLINEKCDKRIKIKFENLESDMEELDYKINGEIRTRLLKIITDKKESSYGIFSACIDFLGYVPNKRLTLETDYDEPLDKILELLRSGYKPPAILISMFNDVIKETGLIKSSYSNIVKNILNLIENG
jgi:hypothetical protein